MGCVWSLQALNTTPGASLKGSLALLRALRPFGGSLYCPLLTGLAKESPLRAERAVKLSTAMRADNRIAPREWHLKAWRQLLQLYAR